MLSHQARLYPRELWLADSHTQHALLVALAIGITNSHFSQLLPAILPRQFHSLIVATKLRKLRQLSSWKLKYCWRLLSLAAYAVSIFSFNQHFPVIVSRHNEPFVQNPQNPRLLQLGNNTSIRKTISLFLHPLSCPTTINKVVATDMASRHTVNPRLSNMASIHHRALHKARMDNKDIPDMGRLRGLLRRKGNGNKVVEGMDSLLLHRKGNGSSSNTVDLQDLLSGLLNSTADIHHMAHLPGLHPKVMDNRVLGSRVGAHQRRHQLGAGRQHRRRSDTGRLRLSNGTQILMHKLLEVL